MSDLKEIIEYVIFRDKNESHVFKLQPLCDGNYLNDVLHVQGFRIIKMSFPDKSGEIINEQNVALSDDIPNMRFLMNVVKFKISEWYFMTRWDSPILQLKPFELQINSWHEEVANTILKRIIEMYKEAVLNEKAVYAYLYLINKASETGDALLTEIIIAATSALVKEFTGESYATVAESIGIPQGIQFDSVNDHTLSRKIYEMCTGKVLWKMEDILIALENLIHIITIRKVEGFKKLSDINDLFFDSQNVDKYDKWFDNLKVERLTTLLGDDSLNLKEISDKMRYSPKYSNCFISYSKKDQEFADKLYTDLDSRGVKCWYSPKDVNPGQKLHIQIKEAISNQDKFIIILSESSMTSEWVKTEIANTRKREIVEKLNILVPVGLVPFAKIKEWENFDADTGKDSAKEIREYFIPDFSNWHNHADYSKSFIKLLLALEKESVGKSKK